VPAFIEHGIWLATASAARDCLSDTVAHCVALEAAMKQRQAQAYLLYGLDLETHFGDEGGGFSVEAAKKSFLEDEPWQPARSFVEKLCSTPDWGERVIATNLCFEPVVGILIRRELLMRSVKFNGDLVTQALNHVSQLEWEWVRGWTVEFAQFVCEDGEHGSANREVLAGWVAEWLPEAHAAADALRPIFDRLPAGIAFADARANVQIDVDEMFDESGLADLAGAKS
jgi:hypothetical protein